MLNLIQRVEIRTLSRHGFSGRHIAHIVGRHRATVQRVLREFEAPSQERPPATRKVPVRLGTQPRKIESYRALAEHALTVRGLTTDEAWAELRSAGFDGSVRNLRRFARDLRMRAVNRRNCAAIVPCGGSLLSADHTWLLRLIQGKVAADEIRNCAKSRRGTGDADALLEHLRAGHLARRNRAAVVCGVLKGISLRSIAPFLHIDRHTARQYWSRFLAGGLHGLFGSRKSSARKTDDERYRTAVFKVLHAPPGTYGFNRTTWKLADIKAALLVDRVVLSRGAIRQIIRAAGFKFRKAKKVLTSTDPHYHRKLRAITAILRNLRSDEGFFSIDEFGPFAVKTQGGRSLVKQGQVRAVPMRQRSKGRLICTAALELSTNQVTHFYSEKKNTDEMLKLLEVLLVQYADKSRIFLSWDAASWHISGRLKQRVREINAAADRRQRRTPRVALAPLPASAQFLNVIESVFSGMSRAIIHNSDYPSVDACKLAIDRYFAERNRHFQEHPRRAGNKLWGAERVPPVFAEAHNCKDPRW